MVEAADIIENALSIPIATAEHLRLDDSRRLTGPGLLWQHPGAVLDVFFEKIETEKVITLWRREARRILDAIGWQDEFIIDRRFDGGVNLAISAPMDQLYSAIFAAQIAWHFCSSELLSVDSNSFNSMIADLQGVMKREANPKLLKIIQAAHLKGVDVLSDDDELSLGHGIGSQTWQVTHLPDVDDVDWQSLHDIPVALITGTNGKTTTTRLASAIAKEAGLVSGVTSTDFVKVGDDVLDYGDYSGPGGARMLLRDQRLEIGFLEVARGGILRRGLPLRRARAALVVNVAADHLGQFGVNTVEELAVAKFAVHRTLASDGVLVLNADDLYVVNEARNTDATIWWFSLNPDSPQILQAHASGSTCAWLDDGMLVFFDGQESTPIIDVADVPLAMGGASRYNIQNVLGAVCLSRALGLSDDSIRKGLSRFRSNPKDNPGRCNEFLVNGARVFVDFAHNPHSIAAVTETMSLVPAKRRFVLLGHAGDRSDVEICQATAAVLALNPDVVVAGEVPEYLRGRESGETTALTRNECLRLGLSNEQVLFAESPSKGVKMIMERIEPGDLALLLVLSQRNQVFELLES